MLYVAFSCWANNKKEFELINALKSELGKIKMEFAHASHLLTSNVSTVATLSSNFISMREAQTEINHSLRMANGELRLFHDILNYETDNQPLGIQGKETQMKKTTKVKAKSAKKTAKKITKKAAKKSKK